MNTGILSNPFTSEPRHELRMAEGPRVSPVVISVYNLPGVGFPSTQQYVQLDVVLSASIVPTCQEYPDNPFSISVDEPISPIQETSVSVPIEYVETFVLAESPVIEGLTLTDEAVLIADKARWLNFTGDVAVTGTQMGHVKVDMYARIRSECDGGDF